MTTDPTLRFYAENAAAYAGHSNDAISPHLTQFLDALSPGAKILELGSGSGRDAAHMLARGFDVSPTDGSPELAAEAKRRLGRPVRIMRFDELDALAAFDGVYANASLLHAPRENLADILARIHHALKPDGLFWASYKAGDGEGHDSYGRYYNYFNATDLRAVYEAAAPWHSLSITAWQGSGYDKLPTPWLGVTVRR